MQGLLLTACLTLCACAVGQRSGDLRDGGDRADLAGFLDPGDMRMSTGDGGGDLAMPDLIGVCAPLVNELQTAGNAGAADEFIEIYNPCGTQFLLTGYKITYRAATTVGMADSGTIATLSGFLGPNAYYLVANSSYPGAADLKPYNGSITGLAATGGAVGLRDPNGILLDSVGYGSANNPFVEAMVAPAPASARSIARHPNGTDTNNNSTDFTDSTPTPKASN